MTTAKFFAFSFFSFFAFANTGFAQTSAGHDHTAPTERYIEAVYESADSDGAQAYYLFRRADGRTFGFPVSQNEGTANAGPEMPEAMLKQGGTAANPELVGKTFRLIFAEGGDRLVKVILVE